MGLLGSIKHGFRSAVHKVKHGVVSVTHPVTRPFFHQLGRGTHFLQGALKKAGHEVGNQVKLVHRLEGGVVSGVEGLGKMLSSPLGLGMLIGGGVLVLYLMNSRGRR